MWSWPRNEVCWVRRKEGTRRMISEHWEGMKRVTADERRNDTRQIKITTSEKTRRKEGMKRVREDKRGGVYEASEIRIKRA